MVAIVADRCFIDFCILMVPMTVSENVQNRWPPLQNGDRLSQEEFERRYSATPHPKKAELIEGIVFLTSESVSDGFHARQHFDLVGWLGSYCASSAGVRGGDSGSVRLDASNEPQPDAYLRLLTECGGQSKIDKQGYVQGAPELV